jgi:hypothetical protein
MRRVMAYVSTSLIAAILTVAALPAAVSVTARPADLSLQAQSPLTVEIAGGPAKIGADGSVPATIRARCDDGLNAFELDVAIRQEATFGSASLLGPNVVPCDRKWHRIDFTVRPETGAFQPGPATVEAFLAVFDPVAGDLEATDSATVRLR